MFLLAGIFTLACLTTAVGLISSISQYFATISKIKYKTWTIIFIVWSLFIANFGLTNILSISVPILNAIYPLALVLIVLALLDHYFIKDTKIYKYTIVITTIISILQIIDQANFLPSSLTIILQKIPFYEITMGWVIPALFVFTIVFSIEKFIEKNLNK